jgi:high-affinity iron transporter
VLANLLIGLREGLEASLVVSILVAYLVRTGHRDRLRHVALGVAAAVALSLLVGGLLTFTSSELSFEAQEAFGGTLSIIAVAFVTWMVFWMRRAARFLKSELDERMRTALTMGTAAVVTTAFLAVGREGLETSFFIWAAVRATGDGAAPITGASIGIVLAVILAYLLYRGSVRINLGTFFRWTGAGLVVVAAGVLAYGVHDLQEADLLPGLHSLAFDVSSTIPPASWYGTLLKGTVNFSPATTWLQAIVWAAYIVPVMFVYFSKPRVAAAPPARTPATVG